MQLAQEVFPQNTINTWPVATHERDSYIKTPQELAGIVSAFPANEGWLERVQQATRS